MMSGRRGTTRDVPDQAYDAKAAEWRPKLAEWQASTQPATQPQAAGEGDGP